MEHKELKVHCPCCKAALVVDAETGGVLAHKVHKEQGQSLEDFLKQEKTRGKDLEEKFAESRRLEDSKFDLLEKKFQRAIRNKDQLPDPPKPGIMWD